MHQSPASFSSAPSFQVCKYQNKRVPSTFEEFSKFVANAVKFGMLCSVSPALLLRANSIAPEFTSHSTKQHRFMEKISSKGKHCDLQALKDLEDRNQTRKTFLHSVSADAHDKTRVPALSLSSISTTGISPSSPILIFDKFSLFFSCSSGI